MPIAQIRTNLSNTEDHRRLAKAGTEVFSSLGLRHEHITTTFIHVSSAEIFVADRTFEEAYGDEKFVLVSVAMGSKRGTDVRARLAQAYTDAVAGIVDRLNVAVDFVVRDPGDIYVGGVVVGLATAADLRVGEGQGTADLDQRLRRVLTKHWNIIDDEWQPQTLLAELRPPDLEWDSLEVATLAVVVENNLGLARGLDIGEEEIREAFGDDAAYADLLQLVESCAR